MLSKKTETELQHGEYQIGDHKYFQGELVTGQKLEVMKLLKGLLMTQFNEKGAIEGNIPGMLNVLTGDFLPHFVGAILLREDEKPVDLARVRSFVDRGNELLFQMKSGMEQEIVNDFFSLNPTLIDDLLSMFGTSKATFLSGLSKEPKGASGSSSKPSAAGGGRTRKSSSGNTPSANSTST
jgi:hypothetical protein